MPPLRLRTNEVEAANRAEATALLIRAGYRVYHPEADCYGEDLVVRTPTSELLAVQLKGRPTVDKLRYGDRDIWMLFPDPGGGPWRDWFLVPHDHLYRWFKRRSERTSSMRKGVWYTPYISKDLSSFLGRYALTAR